MSFPITGFGLPSRETCTNGPAAVLSPFIYTEIVLVIVLGYLVFGDLPNRWTITGAAIVVASGLYILNRERQVRRNSGISPK